MNLIWINQKNKQKLKLICLTLFVVYIFIVLRLTIFRSVVPFEQRQINLTPFLDLMHVYTNVGILPFLRLFLGNIGWFVPFGFLLPMLLQKCGFLKVILMGFCFSLFIETVQYLSFRGVAELDDLILNTLGVAIGYSLFKLFGFLIRIRGSRYGDLRQD